MSLRDFAEQYANLIEVMTDTSHSGKCPKIEANYDDAQSATVNPLNASIFYLFFSTSRASRNWASWMIAAARFPNDRMRRAYMRMFAWRKKIL